jgi:hypothetical protein
MGYALGLPAVLVLSGTLKKPQWKITNFTNRIPLQGLDQLGNSTLEH